ncbi:MULTISPECIES: MurR/RpiR family transcriptional regulator [Priestia]|jgi:DNA-binding MurR/RpiR family transcriptional regulator|uniref:MurR/RpiR family transcriptional regulator n=7 Tax=Priestia TaxID=2800373 RepID=A0AAE5P276_PRIMG|nr:MULTISPECIES: MurR/RpiR family transcriptional regulator [Priestia]KOP69572.1 RpiR family transcriptional regulator [Bacillus sp. FJAT-21351]KQU24919.1 RpiR family transcriptional regulator [Bacillus sp. Leaf75]MBZ5482475.1 MurR/RpiR family transcriptional regulator [Bacillus sp. T_4]MCJ7983096.1 MurR/RpiR family transcriptional regulator [Priestia sp. OVL9]RFB34236.1 MurR/RpiR family transcriptional regulator [Bacillus sp. RC]
MNAVNVLLRIESSLYELPKSERKVAQYILEHPEQVVRMTIHELAAQANASSSAVTRLCRSLEVGSFSELKVSLSSHISRPEKAGFYDIEPNETIASIKDKIVSNSVQVIQETALNLDEDIIHQTIKIIKDTPVIYVYGVGASWLVAEDISHKWLRVGKIISAYQDSHITATALASSHKDALFFCISNSGETKEVLQLVDIAKSSGIKTIGLSRLGNNSLSNKVDISLHHVRAPEAKHRSAATTSLFAQFLTIDILFYTYVSNYFDENIKEIARSRESISKLTEKK